jgi:hypothetical protein
MQITIESLKIFLVLLPGFLSSIIFTVLVVRKTPDHFSKFIEALVFSFIIYTVVVGIFHIELALGPERSDIQRINPQFLIATIVLAVFIPVVMGFFITNDLHMRPLRFLRITTKTARDTTWLDVFTAQKRYVIVNLTGGRRVFGWPLYFSHNPKEGLLYLYDPEWIDDDGNYIKLNIHGLFIVEKGSIESIEFTHVTEQDAKKAFMLVHLEGEKNERESNK